LGATQQALRYSSIVRTRSVFITVSSFRVEVTVTLEKALHLDWLFLCKNCPGSGQIYVSLRRGWRWLCQSNAIIRWREKKPAACWCRKLEVRLTGHRGVS